MRLSHTANFAIHYQDIDGRPLAQTSKEFSQETLKLMEAETNQRWTTSWSQEVAEATKYAIEKPDWFKAAEQSARRFVRGLGLEACRGTQITVLDITTPEDAKRVFPHESLKVSPQAQYAYPYGIVARLDKMEAAYRAKGIRAVAYTLVHELTHAAEWVNPNYLKAYDSANNKWYGAHRQGFGITQSGEKYGAFFVEGIATFNSGLFARRQQDQHCPVVTTTDSPSMELPEHYTAHRPDPTLSFISGVDGYAIELMAWGAEQKGVTTAEQFIQTALKAYSVNHAERLKGFRGFARLTNTIQTGLYQRLQNLEYGRDAWQQGLELVHDAVTT